MQEAKPVSIISDSPELKSVKFGYDAYAMTIAEVIANKKNKTPYVIGIYGSWGSGKTTLMKAVVDILKSESMKNPDHFRKIKTVWFQAWKYKDEDEILAALIDEIFKTMKQDSFKENVKANFEEFVKGIDIKKGFFSLIKGVSSLDLDGIIGEMKYKDKVGYYETFQEIFSSILWSYLKDRPQIDKNEKPDDSEAALVVFIDDLDRCPESRIVSVLETIKLFMDKPGCVFVVGAAIEIIEKALQSTYKEDALKFMDKIVQITFNLPQVPGEDMKQLLADMEIDNKDKIMESIPALSPALGNNPRQVKRFLNNLNLQVGIIKNKGISIDFEFLLNWSIIEYMYPSLAKSTKVNPYFILMLKEEIDKIEAESERETLGELSKDVLEKVPLPLQQYMADRNLRQIMKNFSCDIDGVRQLVTLSSLVETKEEKTAKSEKELKQSFDNMVEIPAGTFIYGDDKQTVTIENPYFIDVYPVTNSQYEKFVDAGGYGEDEYWSQEGALWRQKGNITQPRYWENEEWNKPDHPVVGVSFYEAEAYAKWSGKRLPSEVEWERAARGTDGREYPWGNEFDKDRCNCAESGIGHTTSVTQYPNGRSQDNCYDMAGNVWEWTSSFYDKDEDNYVLRGGSWAVVSPYCRCTFRLGNPYYRVINVGFRCARI